MRRQTLHKKAHKSAHRRVPCKHSHLFVFTSFEPITTYHNQNKTKKKNVQVSFHDDRLDVGRSARIYGNPRTLRRKKKTTNIRLFLDAWNERNRIRRNDASQYGTGELKSLLLINQVEQ